MLPPLQPTHHIQTETRYLKPQHHYHHKHNVLIANLFCKFQVMSCFKVSLMR